MPSKQPITQNEFEHLKENIL